MAQKHVEIKGEAELRRKLAALSEAVRGEKLAAAVRAGAALIENSAKEKAPYRTGSLRRSLHTEVEGNDTRAEATIGTDVVYAAQVEFGGTITPKNKTLLRWVDQNGVEHFARSVTQPARPYLRPAFDEEKDNAVGEIKAALQDLVRYLAANPGVRTLVGERIYPLMLPERVTLPAIRYQQISSGSEVAHTGPSGLKRARIQLTVHAATYAGAQAVAAALYRALNGKKGLFGPGTAAFVTNDLPDYEMESGQYVRHVDVEPWHREVV